MSLFVVDNLDLDVGDQSQLIVAKGLSSENKVKLVAHAVKQNRGVNFLSIYKFAYDSKNGTIYVKVAGVQDANKMQVKE